MTVNQIERGLETLRDIWSALIVSSQNMREAEVERQFVGNRIAAQVAELRQSVAQIAESVGQISESLEALVEHSAASLDDQLSTPGDGAFVLPEQSF